MKSRGYVRAATAAALVMLVSGTAFAFSVATAAATRSSVNNRSNLGPAALARSNSSQAQPGTNLFDLIARDTHPTSGSLGLASSAAPLATNTPTFTPPPTETPPPACGLYWRLVASPDPGIYNTLYAVAVVSANDVWAVDFSFNGSVAQSLTEHWDGSSWSVVPSPNVGSGSNHLNGAAVVAANDVWAVGNSSNGSVNQTLTEHWDGGSWSVVPSPNQGAGDNYLYAVTEVATDNVWAVGSAGTQTLIEHWDGSSWSVVSSPNVGSTTNILHSITKVTANDMWTVGAYTDATNGPLQTLVEHWDGSAWSVVPSPNGSGDSDLRGVAAVSANDIWAIGYSGVTSYNWVSFSEHWDGSSWSIVPIPRGPVPPSVSNSTLWGIAVVSATDIWAVGDYSMTLTEHYSDPCSTATATASPTNTSTPTNTPTDTPAPPTQTPGGPTATPIPTNTPTSTPAPATNTPLSSTNTPVPPSQTPGGPTATPIPTNTPAVPTATPTDCANLFVDITGNIFYTAIHYLNCRGVVNGTDASHYSPAGTSTRGQFAKVVVLGFGVLFYTPATPDFTDVPPSYFAYLYIESGYHAGILSGFDANSCVTHGAAYPCYLPNIPITRGQLTKLVVNAAQYPLYTPTGGTQTFTDVPPSNVFYVSIETAHYKGVINGYPDGSFRPNNNIRRDEMAQIVYKGVTTP